MSDKVRESVEERIFSGELTWLGVYLLGGQQQEISSEVLASLRKQYGPDNIILAATHDIETGGTIYVPGELAIYGVTAALQAEQATK